MKKEEPVEHGHLTAALMPISDDVDFEPSLDVVARVGGKSSGENKFRKVEADRLRKEIKAAEDQLTGWDSEEVSKRALKSLKRDLAVKKARLMEAEAMMDDDDDDEIPEEGTKGKGAVVGGPYQIVKAGKKWLVKNMEKGTVKGTFYSRADAVKQFRLLEGIEHGSIEK